MTSVMWVVRLTFSSSKCERSPSPVNVGANTVAQFLKPVAHAAPAPPAVP